MESADTYWTDRALLEWQIELGATDAIGDAPVDRYALAAATPKPAVAKPDPQAPPPVPQAPIVDPLAEAKAAADAAPDIAALQNALQNFAHCDLRRGARNTVFATGNPAARVMIIAEAPNRDEDRAGVPFTGPEGDLLGKMLAAIGLDDAGAYLAAPLPWRAPNDGQPAPRDLEMLTPFLTRHITLANPDVVVVMGNTPLQMLTGAAGLTRKRGTWITAAGKPCLPMFHPGHLLRNTNAKRDAWADLLSLQAKLKAT